MVFIYRQEILKDISLFTSQPKAKFYDELFINLDLSCIPAQNSKFGRASYSNHSMICAFIVMKCEGFSQISDLHDYLSNNLIIAHYCGFDISHELPSYAKFTRFIREFDNDILQTVMQSQVLKAADLSLIDSSFIALDATPVKANVSNNNPKSFKRISSPKPLIQSLIKIAGLVFKLLQISTTKRIMNSIGVTKIIFLSTAYRAYPFVN